MKPARILFLVGRREDVSVRFRVEQLRPHLARRGIESEVVDLRRVAAGRFPAREVLRRAERIVVHRALLDRASLLWLRAAGRPWAFDFDDAIDLPDPHRPGSRSIPRERRLARMLRAADRVVAGSTHLAARARHDSKAVALVTTTVDVEVVGWIGTRANLPYLERLLPALRRLERRRPALRLQIVCDAFPDASRAEERVPWTLAGEQSALASFAVGTMPLPDDAWTRGKCALKILQCFAAGRPVVCSPVGTNLEVVEDGETGFFAVSEEEWIDRLDRLLGDPTARVRMGAAARRTLERRYATAANVDRFLAAIGLGEPRRP
jgi:glycosyltransferase involved in cell wall biosynthesis